jgi:superfamily II DNA or RNA helicase/phage anti-repressor protein
MFKTKLQHGLEYELFIQSIIKSRYKNCWLWNQLPKSVLLEIGCINTIDSNCDDIGCDIVCQLDDGSYEFIQCKNYSTTGYDNTINICDLAGFYNFIAETGFNGIVYYSGKLSQQIVCRKKKIKYINVPHIKDNMILDFTPRDYQIEAYNQLKDYNRSVLSMPCGTGKTFVSFLLSLDYKNVIILTPLISTTEQILNHYKNYYSKYENVNYTLINCCATRKVKDIIFNSKNIIASTYDSCDIIIELLKNTNITIDNTLIIIDEFHNISSNMIMDNSNLMNKILLSDYKILFVSATPKSYDTSLEHIFGNVKYELNWNDAIKNNYICDYNFYYPNNDKIIEKIDEIKFDRSLIEKTILINKSYFLLESIKLTNVKKCIVYLKSINESDEFVKVLKTINIYFNLDIKVYEINYKTSKQNRIKYLNKFKLDDSSINIICNVHILDEGIDIPECDSIFLTHPNNDPINLIQRISRANRIDKNNKNKIAKIFLWSKDKLKLENIIVKINKVFEIKYGNEKNEFINNNQLILNADFDKNKKIQHQLIINKKNLIDYYNKVNLSNIINNEFIKFIDEFFIIYDRSITITDFVIDLDVITKWLSTKKYHLKDTLKSTYMLDVDYTVKNEKSTGGRPNEKILLTIDCFKKICMLSKTKKSQDIRTYFFDLEKYINKYKNDIMECLTLKIEMYEK